MKHPAHYLPGLQTAVQTIAADIAAAGVPEATLELVHLRASQINGCAWCLDFGYRRAISSGESADRLAVLPAWRESPDFADAERAALALAESMTRLADRPEAVSDEVWDAAAAQFDDKQLSALIGHIALTTVFNRVNATARDALSSADSRQGHLTVDVSGPANGAATSLT